MDVEGAESVGTYYVPAFDYESVSGLALWRLWKIWQAQRRTALRGLGLGHTMISRVAAFTVYVDDHDAALKHRRSLHGQPR